MAVTGTGANRVLLVFPSRREADHYMVDRLLKRAGCKREDFYILTLEDIDQTPAGFALTDKNVRAVVALGEAAQAVVLGETDVLRWRGRFVKFAGSDRCWATSTFLPSDLTYANFTDHEDKGLRHPPRYQGVWALDLLRALNVAKNGYTRVPGDYLLDPSPDTFEDWVEEFERNVDNDPDSVWLSWDIETPYKLKTKNEEDMESEEEAGDTTILRISFSYRLKHAVTVPWTGPYMRGIRRLLGSRCWKIVWNGRIFDVPIVTAAGVPVMGEIIDGMDAWHFLHSDLDKGLEFVTSFYSDLLPWKHLSNADPLLYSAIDADAALHNTLGTIEDLMKQDRWEAFYNDGHLAMKVFDEAAARGNLIDLELRSKYLTEWTETQNELVGKLQQYVPDPLRPRKRYKKLPKADDGPVFEAMVPTGVITAALYADGRKFVPVETQGKFKRCSVCGMTGVTKGEHFKALPPPPSLFDLYDGEDLLGPKPKKKPKKPKKQPNPCKAAGAVIETVEGAVTEWDELLPFNPNSSEQLKAYMRHYGHPLGKHKKDEKKETAEAKHLKKLIGLYGDGFPLYALAYEAKKIGGAISKYLKVEPDANGRIHTVYTNSPTTWRTGSRGGPHATNMQNWGKRDSNPYAKKARAIIIPEPGYSFVQADSSSIEAVFVGYEMGDAQYLDLATKGIHDWLVCQMLGWEFNEESKAKIKAEHGALRDQMKFTNHMTNYGGTPKMMVETHPDVFKTEADAKKCQGILFKLLPQLKEWQHQVRVRAQKENFLQSPFRARHYFYDVFSVKDGKIRKGKDANRAIAFIPQNGAGMFGRQNVRLLGDTWLRPYMPANIFVHDGYCVSVPDHLVDLAADTLEAILTRPIPELGGLRVGCEIEVGKNWKDMKTIRKVVIPATLPQQEAA